MSPLIKFNNGDKVNIRCINCGDNFKRRLSELGLFNGAEIEIVKNDHWGPVVIKIFDSKIVLGRGEAIKIYAEKK